MHCLLTVVKAILNVGLRGRGGEKREGGEWVSVREMDGQIKRLWKE